MAWGRERGTSSLRSSPVTDTNSAIHKAESYLATSCSQKAASWNHSPEGVPAGSSHSQPMGHFSVEWWNDGIVPGKSWNSREPLGRRLCE